MADDEGKRLELESRLAAARVSEYRARVAYDATKERIKEAETALADLNIPESPIPMPEG